MEIIRHGRFGNALTFMIVPCGVWDKPEINPTLHIRANGNIKIGNYYWKNCGPTLIRII